MIFFSEQSSQVTGENEPLRSKRLLFLSAVDDLKDKSLCQPAGETLASNTKPSSSLLPEATHIEPLWKSSMDYEGSGKQFWSLNKERILWNIAMSQQNRAEEKLAVGLCTTFMKPG